MQLSRYLANRYLFQVDLATGIVDVDSNNIPFLIVVHNHTL
jgi:hypothetical protein